MIENIFPQVGRIQGSVFPIMIDHCDGIQADGCCWFARIRDLKTRYRRAAI